MVNLDYLYNPDAAKLHFDTNYFSDKKLGFKVIENGTILPCKIFPKTHQSLGGIVDSEDNYIKESFIHVGTGGKYTPPLNQFNTALKPLFIPQCFIICGDMPLLIIFAAFGF